ncbi:MAG TPA: hypothetical protein VE959_13005 [Bryobacteraceae bacterium]|nr:hypothetical protein [Bryobacteraceae bacterium]
MNTKLQFRILYRQFLFRLMDVELLSASARGDSSQLFGQFGALLIAVSVGLTWMAIMYGGLKMRPETLAASAWHYERDWVTLTLLVVGLFVVLSWDSTFLDRRDVLVLAPLPVRGRTMFAAKIAAVASALGLVVAALHCLSGFAWPMALAPPGSGIVGTIRFVAAFWITMLASGAFLYCAVLGVQGVAAQLPRRWYLRVSSFLQIAAFILFLGVVCLQPSFATAKALGAAENQRMLARLPSYWFMGLLSELSGAFPAQAHGLMAPLARRALVGLATAILVAAGAFLLSYFRTLRKIVEEPDIVPGSRGGVWLPRFGNSQQTALVQFTIRTLVRSRQHRLILSFYLGIASALVAVSMKMPGARTFFGMLASSVLMLGAWVLGTRVVFSLPLDLRANWVFRVTPVRGGAGCLSATRRALLTLSVLPVWVGCAVLFLWEGPWPAAAEHLLLFGLLGSILADLSMRGFRKIPFTCSYLPGKSKVHMVVWPCMWLLVIAIPKCVELELRAMADPLSYWVMAVILGGAAVAAHWLATRSANRNAPEIQYEESPSDAVIVLSLEGPA